MMHNGLLFAPEQFRMVRLQVYNWGTFSNLHTIDISEKGFLFIGPSGSGKSTLLDAFSALLIPAKWVDFNAAARENERRGKDRNLLSYIRGAYGAQQDDQTGEISTQYLREGTTWSALALTYQTPSGKYVVLAQILWVRGKSNSTQDVRRQFIVLERSFDLLELEPFALSNFDVRKLKEQLSGAYIQSEFTPYRERFCRLLGIESENALRLLHKTQSAKNLGDLNSFLREFMLDKPETFTIAERLVAEFGELNEAHQAIVTAREQIQTLKPAQDIYQQREILLTQLYQWNSLLNILESYHRDQKLDLLKQQQQTLETSILAKEGDVTQAELLRQHQMSALMDLKQQHHLAGGGLIEIWEKEKALEIQKQEVGIAQRNKVATICQKINVSFPDSSAGFAELQRMATQQITEAQQQYQQLEQQKLDFSIQQQKLEKEFEETKFEIAALEKQPSNIPAHMLELRRKISDSIGIAETELPFIGELIDVKPEEAAWQGSIERVLHSFALSLLVNEQHYAALSAYVNQTHLGKRLVYYKVQTEERGNEVTLEPHSLIQKLLLKQGKYLPWLEKRLQQTFDYACVEDMTSFRQQEKAITKEGQIKHSKTRHEKDDRRHINDRKYWILGFDNREKLALYQQQAQEQATQISQLLQSVKRLSQDMQEHRSLSSQYERLLDFKWSDIDITPILERIGALEQRIQQAQSNNHLLLDIEAQIKSQEQRYNEADRHYQAVHTALGILKEQLATNQQKAQALIRITTSPYTESQAQQLAERFQQESSNITLDTIDTTARKAQQALNKDISECNTRILHHQHQVENAFAEFKRRWPIESSDMDNTLLSASDFFALLHRIEEDGLPEYEHKFLELLQQQSHQNLSSLSTHLQNARREIIERMDQVNESLAQVPFNQHQQQKSFLKIQTTDKHLLEVKLFRQALQSALSYSFDEDQAHAEQRFEHMKAIVEKLASQSPEQRRWRDTVLDVRLHVEFIGQEIDEEGKAIEFYQSGAGKSGGQRQKLTATCLAAALRYQLGSSNEYGVPIYAPIILDEAFDKADNEFTALAMNIFKNFGFQMIVATPLKSVMTLSPFIGGACFISIKDRKTSSTLAIEYLEEQQRLNLPSESP